MANQWSQSPTRASLSVRGAAYDVEVRADEDQLQLVLEDASNGQAWSGSLSMRASYMRAAYPKDSRCTKSLR